MQLINHQLPVGSDEGPALRPIAGGPLPKAEFAEEETRMFISSWKEVECD